MYHTAEPVMRWCKANEQYLVNRQPGGQRRASCGRSATPISSAATTPRELRRCAVHRLHARAGPRAHSLPADPRRRYRPQARPALTLLILPNVGALSDAQAAAIRRFVERGGSLIATGATSLYNEWGDARPDFALADLFGCHRSGRSAATCAAGAAAARSDRRVCAESERPHLPAADSRAARACRRPAGRRRAGRHRHAPSGAARVRRDRHLCRSAAR